MRSSGLVHFERVADSFPRKYDSAKQRFLFSSRQSVCARGKSGGEYDVQLFAGNEVYLVCLDMVAIEPLHGHRLMKVPAKSALFVRSMIRVKSLIGAPRCNLHSTIRGLGVGCDHDSIDPCGPFAPLCGPTTRSCSGSNVLGLLTRRSPFALLVLRCAGPLF